MMNFIRDIHADLFDQNYLIACDELAKEIDDDICEYILLAIGA